MHSSGGTGPKDKNHGVELWINATIPYGTRDSKQIRLGPTCRVVARAAPRLLIAKITGAAFQRTVAVGHAPRNQAPASERLGFWNALSVLTDEWNIDLPLLDANARVGQGKSEFAGPLQQSHAQDKNGDEVHRFLAEDQVIAANAKLPAAGPGHSWTASNKATRRIDYACAFQHLWHNALTVQPASQCDTGVKGKGRAPIEASFD